MDHERYPYYFGDANDGRRIRTSLPEAFLAAIEALRRLVSPEPKESQHR
jgi:hypothetical protein